MPASLQFQRPKILFIDAYDSFTNNIISLLTTTLDCSVRVLHIDTPLFPTDASLAKELRRYDAIVLGPGPGHPENESDVGLMRRIWVASAQAKREGGSDSGALVDIPILGICLGFQSLGLQCGGAIKRLAGGGMHGVVRRITHCGQGIYKGVGEVDATLYQSLCVDIGQNEVADDRWDSEKWTAKWTAKWKDAGLQVSGSIEPLAWVEQNVEGKDKRILVASKHSVRPWWGIQYHPESICTNNESRKVILNWMDEVNKHNFQTGRNIVREGTTKAEMPVRPSLLGQAEEIKLKMNGSMVEYGFENENLDYVYASKVIDLPENVGVPDIIGHVDSAGRDLIILESTNHNIKGTGSEMVRGRYSIIALQVDTAMRVEYSVGNDFAKVLRASKSSNARREIQVFIGGYGGIWPFLANYLDKRGVNNGDVTVPFWGGFMGYTTYELGLEGINVPPHPSSSLKDDVDRPDLNFAWITDSIVIDHQEKKVHLQQLMPTAMDQDAESTWWLKGRGQEVVSFLCEASSTFSEGLSLATGLDTLPKGAAKACTPVASTYESSVRTCQSHISAGESYELCLTSLSTLNVHAHPSSSTLPSIKDAPALSSSAWSLYSSLRTSQPSPFSSFIRLGQATFISCSPERFMSWTSAGRCELRPMKGTVKKSLAPTRAEAEALLDVEKERAENLMIVDLVRHDLYGVCGAGNVSVARLMGVEEYESVWQMVTVVVGNIPGIDECQDDREVTKLNGTPRAISRNGVENGGRYSGVDVLAASLPPGSMTGAPKKRSCELLNEIEHGRRSLYSGVVGFMDVGGRGDWSVNIRCAFKWDDEGLTESGQDTWYVGAGGAVTALSEDRAEREEMETKLFNTLNGFRVGLDLGKPSKLT